MFKKILFILIFINLANCGFVPINDLNNNKNIKIQSIEIVGGDRIINIALQRNLKNLKQKIVLNYGRGRGGLPSP